MPVAPGRSVIARVAVLALALMVGACGGENDTTSRDGEGDSSSSAGQVTCPLSAAQVAAIVGTAVAEPYVEEYEDHGLREIYGDTVRGCIYAPTSDDTGNVSVELTSIQTGADEPFVAEFRAGGSSVEAQGRLWRAEATQTAYGSDYDTRVEELHLNEQALLDAIASGGGAPATEAY